MGAVGQQDAHRLDQRVAQRRPGQQGEGLGPVVVVHEVEVAHGDDLGGDRRHGAVREAVEDVLAPHVHGIEQPRVVRLGEVPFAGLQFVGVEDDVGGTDEGESDEDAARGQRVRTPLLGEFGVHGGEFVLAHDPGERAAGEDQFARRGEFAVLVGQGEGAQPGLVAGVEPGVAGQAEDGVGQFLGLEGVLLPVDAALVVQGGGDGRPDLRGGEHGPRGGREGAELLQERVRGVRVGDLQAEPGQDLRIE